MGSYTSEISFSGKATTIWGQGKVLDAAGGGQLFSGEGEEEEEEEDGAGSLLELHDAVLQNGDNPYVSERVPVIMLFWSCSGNFP
jgi:hypothetical protein